MSQGLRSRTPEGALEHILRIFQADKFRLIFALAGIDDIHDLLTLDDISILKEECALDSENKVISLTIVEIARLKKLVSWYYAQENPELSTWFELTPDNFKSKVLASTPPKVTLPTPSIHSTSTDSTTPSMLPGVKRCITDYPRLREDKMWMSFNRVLCAMAATHALSEVLDPTYVPPLGTEPTFNAKNTFMYSVFAYSLLSAKSKVPLRTHEKNMDAQSVYKDLLAAYSDGTTAHLTAEVLEQQL